MKAVGIIPARWEASRFKGKVLAKIAGKPMIQHVWENAAKSSLLNELIIACDDERIIKAAKVFGANAVLTSKNHASGTDRIIEAAVNIDADIIVNIQADEPLIHHSIINNLISALIKDNTAVMATVIKKIEFQEQLQDVNVVKVVVDKYGNAMYFSRRLIPYNRTCSNIDYFKHLGIYAYRKNFLKKFNQLPSSRLEASEKLEQLRVLEAGYKIKTVITEIDTIGVDIPEDIIKVEKLLNKK